MTTKSISFQGIKSARASGRVAWEISMEDFQKGVVSGEYNNGSFTKDIQDTIGKIRSTVKKDPEYSKYKMKLPGVLPQGIFKPCDKYPQGRRKEEYLSRYTGVVAVDIDGIVDKKDLFEIRSNVIDQLGKYSYVIATSPGGLGLHIYLRAGIKSKGDLTSVLKSVSSVLKLTKPAKVDPATKDVTRILFCSWDPDAHINESPDFYDFATAPSSIQDLRGDTSGSSFFDIESILIEKKFMGKVRSADYIMWKCFCLLAERFPREYVDEYLSDKSRRKRLFHPESGTVNKLRDIKTNLDNAYEGVKKVKGEFDNYFMTRVGIYEETRNDLGEEKIQGVSTDLFFRTYGKNSIFQLREYALFGNVPNNYPNIKEVDYEAVSDHIYNLYRPLKNKPIEGPWDSIKTIFEHLFEDQVEYIYDYVRLLLIKPSQPLPILVLISGTRETGKTTFLNLMRGIFNPNSVIISMVDFASPFNSHYANKLVVGIDESKLEKRELERIKALSTGEETTIEFKCKDKSGIRNLQHFIIASNDLDFAYLDRQENRFWTFQIGVPKVMNPGLYNAAKKEIPGFIHYLIFDHKMACPEEVSRSWFPIEVVTKNYRGSVYEQVKHTCLLRLGDRARTWFSKNDTEKVLRFSLQDLHDFYSIKLPRTVLSKMLDNESWLNQYDPDERLQYHSDFLQGLPDMPPISANLSARNDRRRGLYYINRDDVIDYDEENETPF